MKHVVRIVGARPHFVKAVVGAQRADVSDILVRPGRWTQHRPHHEHHSGVIPLAHQINAQLFRRWSQNGISCSAND